MKIALFVGHVGKDSGAIDTTRVEVGDHLYSIEAVVTACVTFKIAHLLKILGHDNIIVDGDFEARINDSCDCDIGISVHADISTRASTHGYHIIHYRHSAKGKELATYVDEALAVYADRHRNPHPRNDLYILRKTAFPCILIELGFLSNTTEEAKLFDDEYQWNLAFQIVAGLRRWFYR